MPSSRPLLSAISSAVVTIWFAAVGSPFAAYSADAPGKARPNIIVILSDDMGYSDLGCYGGEIRTPNLDRLAADGLRFTQFYNTGRCCPTRAALLTGLYSHEAGVGHMTEDKGVDSYRGDLSRRAVTIAEALRPVGYRNYMIGKWHVTRHTAPGAAKDNWPLQRGFDRYYGTLIGAGNFYDPGALTRDNTPITAQADPEYQPDRYYYTHALSDHAVRFVNEHDRNHAGQPFFMYLAYTAAHWPMHALDQDIAKYKGKYDAGYDAIRRARLARLNELKLIDERWQPAETVGDWQACVNKAWEARGMEVYAAMIDSMDQGIGKLIAALADSGRLDNTLIFFLQDNGACAEMNGRDAASQAQRTRPRDAAPKGPTVAGNARRQGVYTQQTRDGRPVRSGPDVMPGPDDTFIAYGRNWANVSNTPFREYKHWQHEGGIATPLIAHWPSGIAAARRGALERQPGHLIDLMATCLDVGGAAYPTEHNGQAVPPQRGVSLRPAFVGESLGRTQPLFWEHEGNAAIRDGRWKLVRKHNEPWELYDLEADRTEQHDLASAEPERARQLAAAWQAWANEVGVIEWKPGGAPGKGANKPKAKADN